MSVFVVLIFSFHTECPVEIEVELFCHSKDSVSYHFKIILNRIDCMYIAFVYWVCYNFNNGFGSQAK